MVKKDRLNQPTGIIITFFTFFFGIFAVFTVAARSWSLFRELYCRVYHQSAEVLCHFIDWDFRADIALILIGILFVYPIIHFCKFRVISLQAHIIIMIGFFILAILVFIVSRLLPGPWESWY